MILDQTFGVRNACPVLIETHPVVVMRTFCTRPAYASVTLSAVPRSPARFSPPRAAPGVNRARRRPRASLADAEGAPVADIVAERERGRSRPCAMKIRHPRHAVESLPAARSCLRLIVPGAMCVPSVACRVSVGSCEQNDSLLFGMSSHPRNQRVVIDARVCPIE